MECKNWRTENYVFNQNFLKYKTWITKFTLFHFGSSWNSFTLSYWAKVNHTGTLETQNRLGWGATFRFKISISRMAITTKIHTRIFISRFYDVGTHTETTEIHFVADSSNQEYGVVVYLCSKLNSDVKVSFVLGKSRLAPIKVKSLTIPKLELQAALIAVQIKKKKQMFRSAN